jgi:hypothetical protein
MLASVSYPKNLSSSSVISSIAEFLLRNGDSSGSSSFSFERLFQEISDKLFLMIETIDLKELISKIDEYKLYII